MSDSTTNCLGQPISWLRLERYVLGELEKEVRGEVDEHLAACSTCVSSLRGIVESQHVLPPLPARTVRPQRSRSVFVWLPALALAGAAALFFVLSPKSTTISNEGALKGGGEPVLTLLRDRDGSLVETPNDFQDTDRFKVLLTCGAEPLLSWKLVVIQNGQPTTPLWGEGARCGNRVPLPGAFRLSGRSPADVCLVASPESARPRESSSDRASLERNGAVCVRLIPAPD